MDVQVKVISVELNTTIKKRDGGSYQGARLTYRTTDGKVQEQAFHEKALKFNPSIYTALSNASVGDNLVISKEKNGEFWNVTAITPAGKDAPNVQQSTSQPERSSSPAPKGNWETPEERAAKQVYIVRQSSIAQAVALCSVGAKSLSVETVLGVAKQLEQYVFGVAEDEVVGNDFDNFHDDIPL